MLVQIHTFLILSRLDQPDTGRKVLLPDALIDGIRIRTFSNVLHYRRSYIIVLANHRLTFLTQKKVGIPKCPQKRKLITVIRLVLTLAYRCCDVTEPIAEACIDLLCGGGF